ncbi:hypothetical protein [Campylobacter volucris]|nr:hypothetical protein [Campylobacter volucris]
MDYSWRDYNYIINYACSYKDKGNKMISAYANTILSIVKNEKRRTF